MIQMVDQNVETGRQSDGELFNDVTRLNNELTNLVREISKKGRLLERETERRRAAEENLQTLLDASPELVVLADRDGIGINANEAFLATMKVTREQLSAGMIVAQILPETIRLIWQSQFASALQSGSPVEFEVTAEGRWYRVSLFPVMTEKPEIKRMACFLYDVTEQKRLQALSVLASRQEIAEQLASGIAHEVNNVMAGILGNIEILARRHIGKDRDARNISNARMASERVVALVDKLLFFVQGQQSDYSRCDLNELVSAFLTAERKHLSPTIRVLFDIPANDAFIVADPRQVTQVLRSLFSNAIEAIGESGTIRIATVTHHREGFVSMVVSDDGPGMDDAVLSKLFEPFFTTKFLGRGMGLPAANGIVLSHGGHIDVESKPGIGTTVSCTFPIEPHVTRQGSAMRAPFDRLG
ncbi:MAG TPA: ATP-binding protein [Spirochaetia bacterium]|nr:ATP-binding protein [Spirochaetia bacterium]